MLSFGQWSIGGLLASRALLASRHGSGAEELPIWGDGLVDQSLADLWYPSRWSDVSEDEFVFLIPSLVSQPIPNAEFGPIPYLRRALAAHICCATEHLPAYLLKNAEPASIFEMLFRTGVITTLSRDAAWLEGEVASRSLFGRSSPISALNRLANARAPDLARDRERWLFELIVLSSLNDILANALAPARVLKDVLITDALVATIHTSFNAAYVYPQLVCMHELFAAAAWLGHLVRGRPALMPVFVAEWLSEELAAEPDQNCKAGNASQCRSVLRFYADLAIGSPQLLRLARQVQLTRRPMLLRPRRTAGVTRHFLCSGQAAEQTSQRLDRAVQQ